MSEERLIGVRVIPMNENINTKAVVTVAEMARMVGLSRARFYQLMGSTFPEPSRDEETGRPYYTEENRKGRIPAIARTVVRQH